MIEQGRMLEAIDCFRELVGRFPDSSKSHFNLANTLVAIGRYHECVKHYRRAIELNPAHSAARENLGRALIEAERFDEAREVWESWLKRDPDNEFARHMLAAATGSDAPQRCSDDYIRQEFNKDFATTFDRQLSRLDYQSPKSKRE
jgi:tetratricopeptide (TPR) repeat protein